MLSRVVVVRSQSRERKLRNGDKEEGEEEEDDIRTGTKAGTHIKLNERRLCDKSNRIEG